MGSVSFAWLKKMMRMVSSTCVYLTPNYTVYSSIKSEHDNRAKVRSCATTQDVSWSEWIFDTFKRLFDQTLLMNNNIWCVEIGFIVQQEIFTKMYALCCEVSQKKDRIHFDYEWALIQSEQRANFFSWAEYRTLGTRRCIHSNDLGSCLSIHLLTVTSLSLPSKSSKNKSFRIKMIWPALWSTSFLIFFQVFEGKVFKRVQCEPSKQPNNIWTRWGDRMMTWLWKWWSETANADERTSTRQNLTGREKRQYICYKNNQILTVDLERHVH